jgi:protein-S-isoprenylcysteine O-methyltransferase Ste14
MYVVTWLFGVGNLGCLWYFIAGAVGNDLFVSILWFFMVPASNAFILVGVFLIASGWKRIYGAKGQLVTSGAYGVVRHPQYLGFLLVTLGMNVLWLTISTLLLWPILVLLYCRLAVEEDRAMRERFGDEYVRYENAVPMFFPRLRKG